MSKILSKLSNTTPENSSAYVKFAKEHSLVFIADSTDHEDPIKGVSFGKRIRDSFFIQGVSQGHDISIVQRTTPKMHSKESLIWSILQVTTDETLPHIYIDGHRHPREVYQSVFSAFGHYRDLSGSVTNELSHFSSHFTTYGAQEEAEFIKRILSKQILELIYDHGANLDYEMDSHHVRVYNLTNNITYAQLEDMFTLAQNIVQLTEGILNT